MQLSEHGRSLILQALKNRKYTRSSPALLTQISEILEPNSQWPQEDAEGGPLYAFSLPTWQRFLSGKPVSAPLVKATCEVLQLNWRDLVEVESSKELQRQQQELDAAQQGYIARTDTTELLLADLQADCRILLLTGLTGIGKTAISCCLAAQLNEGKAREELCWVVAPDEGLELSQFATACLRSWQIDVPSEDLRDANKLLNRLMAALVDRPITIQLHSFEYCLQGNEVMGWNECIDPAWDAFFQRCLDVPEFAPRLIISSQDLPNYFRDRLLWDRDKGDRCRCQTITGLSHHQRLGLFQGRGLDVQPEALGRPALERIGAAYEGHPLALQIIACEILAEPFSGNVIAYWEKYGKEIIEIEKTAQREDISQAGREHRLHRYSKKLREKVKDRIELTLKRLAEASPSTYILLCHGSVFNRPVPPRFWARSVIRLGWSTEQTAQGIELLVQRYLVEYQQEPCSEEHRVLKLHNLVRSVARDHLKRIESEISRE
ncbi:MAG: hypothetical protein HC824_13315 [Synechococcales cyanobacterium RM1_1_8]|nr:hypothetical protein [Synechococcales cyanobacterium RM1_1_8]